MNDPTARAVHLTNRRIVKLWLDEGGHIDSKMKNSSCSPDPPSIRGTKESSLLLLPLPLQFSCFAAHLREASADVPDDRTADFVDVDWRDRDLEADPEAEEEPPGVQLPNLELE